MNGDLTINDEEEQGTVTVQTNSPLYSSQDSFTPILRLLVQHSHNNEWLQFEDCVERYSKIIQRHWGRGCFLWLRGIASIRQQTGEQLPSSKHLFTAFKCLKGALSSLDVELNAFIEGNMRRQTHWRLMQSIFLRDFVTIQVSLHRHLLLKSKHEESSEAFTSSKVVDLDDDSAFEQNDTNFDRQRELIILNIVQSITLLETELKQLLSYFVGVDVSRIQHLLKQSTSDVPGNEAPSFSFPTIHITTYDAIPLLHRLSMLISTTALPGGSTPALTPATSVPLVTLPDVLSVYLALQSSYLEHLRDMGQLTVALKITRHFLYSLGTIISFLSLMNQAVRMQVNANPHEQPSGDDNLPTTEHPGRDTAVTCHRILSVIIHALRRHRAILMFKHMILEDRLFEISPSTSSSLASALKDISLFEPFDIEDYDEGQRKLSGVDQNYISLDKYIRSHLSKSLFTNTNTANNQQRWMQRLLITQAVCNELAGLHDWMHTSNIAQQLTRELFGALDISPYNNQHSLLPHRPSSDPSHSIKESLLWIVSSETDRMEVADTLLSLYELQARAFQELFLQQQRQAEVLERTIGSVYFNTLVQLIRSKYQAGLVSFLWAGNMPETARRLLESAEESSKPLVALLKSSTHREGKNSRAEDSKEEAAFESMLLCVDISFHLGLAYFQSGMLNDAVSTTLTALDLLKHLDVTVQKTSLGPYLRSQEDVEQIQLRKRHALSQLVWVYSALENKTAAETALQSLRTLSSDQFPEEIPKLCLMVRQRLGLALSGLPESGISSSPSLSTSPTIPRVSKPETAGINSPSSSAVNKPLSDIPTSTLTNRRSNTATSSSSSNSGVEKNKNKSKIDTDERKELVKKMEPLDGHYVASIVILSLFALFIIYSILRISRWDEVIFGDSSSGDESDLFEL